MSETSRRLSFVVRLLSGSVLLLTLLVWSLGAFAAPSRHPQLARVSFGSHEAPRSLSGAAFTCSWRHDRSVSHCVMHLREGLLTLEHNSQGCVASVRERDYPCGRDVQLPGYQSYQIAGAAELADATPRWQWPLHFFGTLGEGSWGSIALLSSVLVPLAIALLLLQLGALRGRLWLCAIATIPLVPACVIGLHIALLSWGYID